jgi:hypothetical protein
MLSPALPEDEIVALCFGIKVKSARWLIWLRWVVQTGRLVGDTAAA